MHLSVFLGLRVGIRINCKWVQQIWGRGTDAKCFNIKLWSLQHNSVNSPLKIYLFLAVLGLCCRVGLPLLTASEGYS